GTSNTQLSVVSMLLPTNDAFAGLNAITIPTAPGTYVYDVPAYDAGTEANDELVTGGGAPGEAGIPADPGGMTGTGGSGAAAADANPNVHIHRNALGDTDPAGGSSDLDSTVHRWLNPVIRVTVTVQ
ncbi:MAG: spondin domain-containing protein, partial [Gammaproteobacteria bacterium]|nr:spondin domain-containing protein [Gammaproteobacteria bacterium]